MGLKADLNIDLLIEAGDIEELTKALSQLSPSDIADILSARSSEDQSLIFSALSTPLAIDTFEFLSPRIQLRLLSTMPTYHAATILNLISPDDRTSFLQELPRDVVNELVKLLPTEERLLTMTLLGYPNESIGRLMTPDYLAVKMDWSIAQVLDHIQLYGHDSETMDVIYVVDEMGVLIGDIHIRDTLFVPKTNLVESIVDKDFIALDANDNDETAIEAFRKNASRVCLPVIDKASGMLLGIVTIDDILHLTRQEDTEDIQKLGGMEALEEPYMQTPFLSIMKKRVGWLMVLFIGELFTTSALAHFEEEIAKAIVLTLFIPLIISSGGNAGSQASTLIIRALALGEVKLSDWWRIIKRELASGLFLGASLGLIGFLRVTLWNSLYNTYGEYWMAIGFTLFFSIMGIVIWGCLCGAVLPLVLRSFKLDPATSSAPFVATLVDVTGVIIYFLIAITFLTGKLL